MQQQNRSEIVEIDPDMVMHDCRLKVSEIAKVIGIADEKVFHNICVDLGGCRTY